MSKRPLTHEPLVLVGPTAPAPKAVRLAVASRFPGVRLVSISLALYASNPRAPLRIVLCPAGRSVGEDLDFLREARRTILWPAPAAEIWSAIAGLRGSHDAPPASVTASATSRTRGRRSVLLLEGDVTLDRARRAALSGAPRDWIVERIQRVRIAAKGLDELRRVGIRWAALEPVEIVALAASTALLAARHRWVRLLPPNVTVWPLTSRPESRVTRPE